eukprot:5085216-Amphidinium_carterae.1
MKEVAEMKDAGTVNMVVEFRWRPEIMQDDAYGRLTSKQKPIYFSLEPSCQNHSSKYALCAAILKRDPKPVLFYMSGKEQSVPSLQLSSFLLNGRGTESYVVLLYSLT